MRSQSNNISGVIDAQLDELVALRRQLHQHAELSLKEQKTAQIINDFFVRYQPDQSFTSLGGHGLAFVYKGASAGPSVLIRCDMDALPIDEGIQLPHGSLTPGISHKCGHDGHMAMVAGLAMLLETCRPKQGKVILLFQPAEETGEGAEQILGDEKFQLIQPDFVFACHNAPQAPLGMALLKSGPFQCASRGLICNLQGETAHASAPENGKSPATAMCRLINDLQQLPNSPALSQIFSMVTIVHAQLGSPAFGTAPGDAAVMATLRTETNQDMDMLVDAALSKIDTICKVEDLSHIISWSDVFDATINDESACKVVEAAATKAGCQSRWFDNVIRGSEDFGRFTTHFPGAIFGLGAGKTCSPLHTKTYDFPDQLIPLGINIFANIIDQILS